MSCDTLNSQSVGLNVAIGNLPEGFCPASMQELAQAIAARLIVTPSQSFNGMAIGSVEPTSNVGLWFKNCEELFVYDDATGRYVPLRINGGFQTLSVQSASGSFIVPDFIYQLRIEGWGGGGGAPNDTGSSQPGGGGGGYGYTQKAVIPGQSIPFTIGMGGPGGAVGTSGTATTIMGMTCNGGTAGSVGASPGAGGTVTGADFSIQGGQGSDTHAAAGGFGGDGPLGGQGGRIGPVAGIFQNGIVPAGGGCGGTSGKNAGGNGANGLIKIFY